MEILYFSSLASTQTYLYEAIKTQKHLAPLAVISPIQYAGKGSRDNTWTGEEGNFFASFAIDIQDLPQDLPLSSASIYFSFLMKESLEDLGENLWLKWPNDFYQNEHKIGGTMTQKVKNTLICGIGINLKAQNKTYKGLNSPIEPKKLLETYLLKLEAFPLWEEVFAKYQKEFPRSKHYHTHIKGKKISLKNAILCKDGSLLLEGEKVFSLR